MREREEKLREGRDLIRATLWSTFGESEMFIVLRAAETVSVECERATAIQPGMYKEAYEFILTHLRKLVTTTKEVHNQWKKWSPPDALRDVWKRLGDLHLQVPVLVSRTAEFIQAKKEEGVERGDPTGIPINYCHQVETSFTP